MTYTENHELLKLAERNHANSITLDLDEGELRLSVPEARTIWNDLAPGDPFTVISINFE